MAPTAMSSQYKTGAPSISYSTKSDGSVRVRHREFIRDVTPAASTFQVTKFSINPGLGNLFQWLSAIGLSYESYRFNSLSFEFESSSSTSDRGTFLMGVDYDASDDPPLTKQELMAYNGSVRSNVWSHACFSASKSDLRKFGTQRFIRGGTVNSTDIKTYDVGNFYAATSAVQTGVTIGELYVTYDVSFYTPQPAGTALLSAYSAKIICTVGVSDTILIGTAPVVTGGLDISLRTNNSLNFSTVGQFMMTVIIEGTGINAGDALTLAPTGCSLTPLNSFAANASSTTGLIAYLLQVTQVGAHITFTGVGFTSVTSNVIRVSPYPFSLG